MKLSAYLSLSRHAVFYFRWRLPRTDRNCRPTIKISLRTRCPDEAGSLARYLGFCGQITKDNDALARLRQDKLRELVRAYFQAQLDQYLEWIDNRGLSREALEDARSEMLDHTDHLDSRRLTDMNLPIRRFKRKMGVSDEDCLDSLPSAVTELRKGRRDILSRILEAAERLQRYSVGAYLGLVPRRYQSGEIDYTGSISKRGDVRVGTLLYVAANGILTRCAGLLKLKTWALAISARSTMRKARVALARRLAIIMHAMMRDGTEFQSTLKTPKQTRRFLYQSSHPGRRPREGVRHGDDSVAPVPTV